MARITGRGDHDRKRFQHRGVVDVVPLGDAPEWLPPPAAARWAELARTQPHLRRSHRCITEMTVLLQVRMANGALGIPGMNLLRQCLAQLGATPTSPAIAVPDSGDDPDDGFFKR